MTRGTPLGRGSLREGAQEGLHQSETSRRWRGGEGIPAGACWGLPHAGGTPLCRSKGAEWNRAAHFLRWCLLLQPRGFRHRRVGSRKPRGKEAGELLGFCFAAQGGGAPCLCGQNCLSLPGKGVPDPLVVFPTSMGGRVSRAGPGQLCKFHF